MSELDKKIERLKAEQMIEELRKTGWANAVQVEPSWAPSPELYNRKHQELEIYQRMEHELAKAKEHVARTLMGEVQYEALSGPVKTIEFWKSLHDAITGPARSALEGAMGAVAVQQLFALCEQRVVDLTVAKLDPPTTYYTPYEAKIQASYGQGIVSHSHPFYKNPGV